MNQGNVKTMCEYSSNVMLYVIKKKHLYGTKYSYAICPWYAWGLGKILFMGRLWNRIVNTENSRLHNAF